MDYSPDLEVIKVPIYDLLLDPNNPRFSVRLDEQYDEADFDKKEIQDRTASAMQAAGGQKHKLTQLKASIMANGWQPVDRVFVQKRVFDGKAKYLVLEGNRRVTAIRELLRDGEADDELRSAVDPLEVVEVKGDVSSDVVRAQITYLLGVRHQGALLPWGPFAQAHDMYERYLRLAGQTDETFRWPETTGTEFPGTKIARILGVDLDKVRERIQVYRVMKQIDSMAVVRAGEDGGILGKYYTLCREVLMRPKKSPLRLYIRQNQETFLLDDESLERMNNLCHFHLKKRGENAPISAPDEWRSFEKILKEENTNKRAEMVKKVEVEKEKPSNVYAERQAELRKPRWDCWLLEVGELLRGLNMGDLERKDPSKVAAIARLRATLNQLPLVSGEESQ